MKAFTYSKDKNNIGYLVFDLLGDKVNKINMEVLEELDSFISDIQKDKELKALVIKSGKENMFIAGADLTKFDELFENREIAKRLIDMGHRVFWKIEHLPFPTIAVVNGVCLGGGLELALACKYRMVTDNPKTALGLPEVNLGIFPGWGGTQRLPRLVGLMQGLTMILTGKPVDFNKAFKIGLADAVIPFEFMDEQLDGFVADCLAGKFKRKKRFSLMKLLLEKNPLGRKIVYWQSRKNILKKTKGQYPAPLAALTVIEKSFTKSLYKGLVIEKDSFVAGSKGAFRHAPSLIHLFFTHEAIKKDPGLPKPDANFLTVKKAAVIGCGTMGSGISWLFSYRDIPIRMKDISYEFIGKGLKNAWDTYKVLMKIRKLRPTQANRKYHNISYSVDYSGFKDVDIVIESAIEDLEVKRQVYKELEEVVRKDTIIATNTSSFTIKDLTKDMKHPERFVGMHFFNPPSRMPLVEIVAGEKTSDETLKSAFEICKRLKKTAIVVGDCSGFLINRIFAAAMLEVMNLFSEGVEMELLEKSMLKFGLPMGPFHLADEVGNDVNFKALKNMEKAYGDRMKVPVILDAMNIKKLYGKKSGKGFYIHKKKKRIPNPEIKNLMPKVAKPLVLSLDEISDRVVGKMREEAKLCLDEGIIKNPEYLELGLVFAVGFPPYKKLL